MKSVKEWIEIIPPDIEIPIDHGRMYVVCSEYINKLSEMYMVRNFVVHKHYYRNG